MSSPSPQSQRAPWRETLRVVIFEADSPECASGGHVDSARFCKDCGAHLRPSAEGEGEGSTPTFPGAGSG